MEEIKLTTNEEAFLDLGEDRLQQKYKLSNALDHLWVCYSLGKSARDLYRYGHRRDCKKSYDHFKFCLSLKTKSEIEWKMAVEQRERRLAKEKAKAPNSLQIWKLRREPPSDFPFGRDTHNET